MISALKPNTVTRITVSGSALVCITLNTVKHCFTCGHYNSRVREVKDRNVPNLGSFGIVNDLGGVWALLGPFN